MAKKNIVLIRLASSADTGFFYIKKKNPKEADGKAFLPQIRPGGAQARRVQRDTSEIAHQSALHFTRTFAMSVRVHLMDGKHMATSTTVAADSASNTLPAGEPSPLLSMAPLLLIFVVLYFLIIRPQMKK